MPLFLNTSGNVIAAVAICDRCKRKFPYDKLSPDRDNPALRVCDADNDQKDPYKKSARVTEKITLRYPRPEEDL
jgi:hypothetical protein